PGDRGGAAVFRQQRRVHVDAAPGRRGEDVFREDLAVSGDDEQLGPERLDAGDAFGRVDALGLQDGDAARDGEVLHALAGLAGRAALLAGGAVRLRHEADDLVRAVEQGLKRRL